VTVAFEGTVRRWREDTSVASRRDARVARWYRWIWLAGMALSAWFFIVYFVPATVRTFSWVGRTIWYATPTSGMY